MMKKVFYGLFLAALAFGLFVLGNNASASTGENEIDEVESIEEVKPFMNFYDEDGNLIKSYDENEMKQFYTGNGPVRENSYNDLTSLDSLVSPYSIQYPKVYNFYRTTINNNVWVGGRSSWNWKDVKALHIVPAKQFKSLIIRVWQGSKIVNTVEVGGFTGGLQIPIKNSSMSSTSYSSVQLVQGDTSYGAPQIEIESGQLYYDLQ